jgi:hypothetical protein
VTNIAVARARRETDNTKTSPVDLLELVLADLREGKIKPDAMLVMYAIRDDGNIVEFGSYRCGLKRLEEVGLLQTAVNTEITNAKP